MKVEPLKLKMLADGMRLEPVSGTRVFIPSRQEMEELPPPPPPPTFTEEEMKAAERDGFQKGFHEGVKEGRSQAESEQSEVNRRLAAQAELFVASVAPLFTHYRGMALMVQQEMPKVALAVARKVAGEALEANGHKVIGELAARCCETMINEPELTINVHESLGNTLEGKLQELAVRLPEATQIIIVRDPDMPLTDCRIEWRHGSMDHSIQDMWAKVEKAIGNMSEVAARDAAVGLDAMTQAQELPAEEGQRQDQEQPNTDKKE